MTNSQRAKIQIMVDITLQRRPTSNTNTTTETFEDTNVVSKRCYRNKHCFLGNYICIKSGSSLIDWIKSGELYVKFVSELPEFIHT